MSLGRRTLRLAPPLLLVVVLLTVAGCASLTWRAIEELTSECHAPDACPPKDGPTMQGVGRPFCASLDYGWLIGKAARVPLTAGHLRVPVAIHIMDRHGNQDALKEWTPFRIEAGRLISVAAGTDRIARLFDPDSEHSVNRIWEKAGIRFDVQIVEHCPYAPPAPAVMKGNVWPPEPRALFGVHPAAQREVIDGYIDTNVRYGIRRTVNLYLWDVFLEQAIGYGESPRRGRIEFEERVIEAVPTAWIEAGICERQDHCQALVAHEFGHALGLKHVCQFCHESCCETLCWAPPGAPDQDDYHFYAHVPCAGLCAAGDVQGGSSCCCGCMPGSWSRDGLNACGEPFDCCGVWPVDMSPRLMHPSPAEGADGGVLCRGEIHAARSAAREFFYTTWRGGAR